MSRPGRKAIAVRRRHDHHAFNGIAVLTYLTVGIGCHRSGIDVAGMRCDDGFGRLGVSAVGLVEKLLDLFVQFVRVSRVKLPGN